MWKGLKQVVEQISQGARLINNLPESQIVKIWQHQLLDRMELTTDGGEPIKIIYPGRINDDQGADFRDAVIATRQGLVKGDIEVHAKSSEWQAHRHHRDQAYNRVILHVVMWHNAKVATYLQNGEKVPVVALHKPIKEPSSKWTDGVHPPVTLSMPCLKAAECLPTRAVAELLDSAGEERFLVKASRFQEELAKVEVSQCLYQGIMGALGYSKNKMPFLKLARTLPLHTLESITKGKVSDEECLAQQQALLLGTAGLLQSPRPNWHQEDNPEDKWIEKLERLWASSHHPRAMSRDEWHLFKVRPSNSPVRRIVAMSYLVLRYRESGIREGLVNVVKEAPVSQGCCRLERGLLVNTDGYWASHFDFGLPSRKGIPSLLGRGRAADIAVNVLLPFIVAWSKLASQPELERKALDLYHSYPRLGVNTVEKHMMGQLGVNSTLINSAQRQQGLIHIYNNLCTQGECNQCRLSQLKTGNHIQV